MTAMCIDYFACLFIMRASLLIYILHCSYFDGNWLCLLSWSIYCLISIYKHLISICLTFLYFHFCLLSFPYQKLPKRKQKKSIAPRLLFYFFLPVSIGSPCILGTFYFAFNMYWWSWRRYCFCYHIFNHSFVCERFNKMAEHFYYWNIQKRDIREIIRYCWSWKINVC